MPKFLYILIAGLLSYLLYSINTEDVSFKDSREYEHKVVVYSKAKCFYCENAKELLTKKNIIYKEVDLTWDLELHKKLINETGQTTVPYIFIHDKFIGGYSDLEQLDHNNKLDELLKNPTS